MITWKQIHAGTEALLTLVGRRYEGLENLSLLTIGTRFYFTFDREGKSWSLDIDSEDLDREGTAAVFERVHPVEVQP